MHLADDGNHVPDLIQCQHPGTTANGDPSKPEWRVHLWKPAHGGVGFGFDIEGEVLEAPARYRCNACGLEDGGSRLRRQDKLARAATVRGR
ncbi:MAG: hypothetical protein R3B70_21290 [Polyangiaceae bacterium]